jgi:hypothetical protein
MNFSAYSVLLFFAYYLYNNLKFQRYFNDLKIKYNFKTWHYGYFADRKLFKLLSDDDKNEFNLKAKKSDRVTLFFLLYSILIFVISGIFFNGKL